MTHQNYGWKAGLSIGLAIPTLLWASCAVAQIRPVADETLGREQSLITPAELNGVAGDLITGGARRGGNLFHSFQAFSIDQGRAAYFANPVGVENILGRVTGGEGSEILGRLGVLGEANLFLVNPNGIVFGPNSSLDIGGSFLATTANAIGFGEEGWFSATTPEAPSPLLTVNPSAFFFNQLSTGDIAVHSTTLVDLASDVYGLSVGVGENLALLGGNITVESGHLNAPGGRIDLGAVEGGGTIGLNAEGSFAFPTGIQRGDIAFSAAAQADVRTPDRGGEMVLTGRSIFLTEESQLLAGLLPGQGTPGSQAGDIGLNATAQILITSSSRIVNMVAENAQGNAGNLKITTPVLEMLDHAQVNTSTFGQGNAGSVIITASDRVTFDNSFAFSGVDPDGVGAGGNIEISAPILEVGNGGYLDTSIYGRGDGGDVIIRASDRVTFNHGAAWSKLDQRGSGSGGNIEIATPILEVLNGGYLDTRVYGRGNGGDVIITADDRVTFSEGGVYSNVEPQGHGKAGNIEITTPILEMLNQSRLEAITFGQGSAGNVIITASDRVIFNNVRIYSGLTPSGVGVGGNIEIDTPILEVLNGTELISDTHGQGNAGDIIITASDRVTVNNSFAFSGVESEGNGTGGDIEISAPIVEVLNGGQVITSTVGAGQAGNILINADRIRLSGHNSTLAQRQTQFSNQTINEGNGESGLFASTRLDSTGNGGSITLNTTDLIGSDRAQIVAQSEGLGAAGKVMIRAGGVVILSDRGGVTTSSQALGSAAGDIKITTDEVIVLDNHASIRSDTRGGQGDIDLATRLLLLQDNSIITTNASGPATGGNIDIEADFIVAAPNENSDIFANAFQGSGGQITLTAQAIFDLEFRTRAELQQLLGDEPDALTPRNLPSNDVTAFSQTSPDIDLGTVTFRTPDVDPSRGLVELPTTPLEAANQITQICSTGGGREATRPQSEFIVTGRGGLPTSPLAPFDGEGILAGWATLDDEQNNTVISPSAPTTTMSSEQAIVEVTGWRTDAAGNVVLVATAPNATSSFPSSNPAHCQ